MADSFAVHRAVDQWIAQESLAFLIDSASTLHGAVEHLIRSLDDSVELLGLGEALHGGEEILILRNRLFRRLVEAHGYTAIAIESNFPRSHYVNEYVQGKSDSTYDALIQSGFSHAVGPLEANRELVEWMRQHNSNAKDSIKIQFYGFDSPTEMMKTESPRKLLAFVLDYLGVVDGTDSHNHVAQRERFERILGQDSEWENPDAMVDPTKSIGLSPMASALRIKVEDLITLIQIRRPELIERSSEQKYLEAMHYAVMTRQLLNYHATIACDSDQRIAQALGQRDAMMADNLTYISSREKARGGKVFVFAHNSHLKYGMAEWQLGPHALKWWPAGAHLRNILGSRYAVIGSGVGVSSQNGIGQPEEGTLEARLLASSGSARLIPTVGGKAVLKPENALLPVRSGSTKNPSYFPFTARATSDFDWLVMLDSVSYSRGGLYAEMMQ